MKKLTINEEKLRDLYLRDLAIGKIQGPPTGYSTRDKRWLKNYSAEAILEDIPKLSIYQYALECNKKHKNDVALDVRLSADDFKHGIKIRYGKLFKKAKKIAKSLKYMGTKPNEKVLIILPNVPEARFLLYANSILGSASYPISPLLPPNQLEKIILDNNVKTVFMFDGFMDKYAKVLSESSVKNVITLDGSESIPVLLKVTKRLMDKLKGTEETTKLKGTEETTKLKGKSAMTWNDFYKLGRRVKGKLQPYYEENHVTAIIGTSGTTGTPKGVCLTDENINGVALAYKNGEYFEGNFLDALLPSIGYGISMIHYQTCDNRYTYLLPELLTTRMADAVETLQPDNFPGGPVHYINLENSQLFKSGNVPKRKNFISGGATLPKRVEESLNGVSTGYEEDEINDDIIVRQGYGLSENTAMGAYNKRGAYKFGSIGIPIIYENVGIFKPGTDEELMYGEQGEICVTGPSVMKEYLNNKEETDKVIMVHEDGKRWIHTKDIGYMDQDGHIFHVDRIKNIFMRTGFNVHPSKIAEHINSLPFVTNSAVIGFEHPEEQAVPVAFVEINKDMVGTFTEDDIRDALMASCYENLEEPSVPTNFIFVDSLPINAGGKIDYPKLIKEADIDFFDKSKTLKKELNFTSASSKSTE